MQVLEEAPTLIRRWQSHLARALGLTLVLTVSTSAWSWDPFGRKRGDPPPSREQAAAMSEFQAKHQGELARIEAGLAEALAGGKAILLVPLYGMRPGGLLGDRETGLNKPYSLDVLFRREGGQGTASEQFNPITRDAPTAIVYHRDGPTLYTVRVVEPGTWHVTGTRINVRGGEMPKVGLKREVRESGFGTVQFAIRDFPQDVKEQRWAPPTFRPRDITADVCHTVHVRSGTCVAWGTHVIARVNEITSAGGWYDVTRTIQRPGIEVTVAPSRPLASVNASAGEVLVLDGLFFRPPGVQFLDECRQVGGQSMACELNSIEYQVWPANQAGFAEAVSKSELSFYLENLRSTQSLKLLPGAAKVFAQAQYRPFALTGKPGWRDAQWGQNMYIEAGK
jgi:hypothetical protein